MRIIFIIDTLTAGGKERRLTELLKGLKSRNEAECELVVMSSDIHYKEILDLGIKIHFIIRKTKKDLTIFSRLYKLFKLYKPDIIHCWDSMTAVYIAPFSLLLETKMVNGMVIDAPRKQDPLNKHWLRAKLTFPFSDVIVGNSMAGLKAYKAPEKKSMVIHNGFNNNRLTNLPDKQIVKEELNAGDKIIIGMVATFSENKDYKTYFKAAAKLLNKRDDILFLAIGKDTDSDISRGLINQKSLEYFRLLGKRSDVEAFINVMDICVLATFTEGISNAIMEYMASGKPVIATSGGGTSEIVLDKETGFLTIPSDPEDLASKIEVLLDSPELRQKMGKAGEERVSGFFSIDLMVDKYLELYHNLIVDK